ncbi:hypothetical protein L7F22_028666 [Adiantum nelumboides]|nr:hypothetical protein [Adiantum nelumboides]
MGTCCSKIDNPNEVCSFNGALHPSIEQWQATQNSCQFCRVNEVAGHSQCCSCETCQRAATHGVKGFVNASFRDPMCSLCVADVYDAQLLQQVACVSNRSSAVSDEDERSPYYDLRHSNYFTEHALDKRHPSGEHAIMQGVMVQAHKQEILKETCASKNDFFCMNHNCNLREHDNEIHNCNVRDHDNEIHSSENPSSSAEEDPHAQLGHVAACEIMGNSRRLSNIDDSDGIKLEVRYKHMLPRDAHIMTYSHTTPHDVNILKRARPQEEPLLKGDSEANQSTQQRKSFRIAGPDEEEWSINRSLRFIDCEDEFDNDEHFHDITVGVNIGSWNVEKDLHPDAELCCGLDTFSLSHVNVCSRDLQAEGELQCSPDYAGFANLDLTDCSRPLYVMSQENLQFISRKEREWEDWANGIGMAEDKISSSKMSALSVVSTGDAILFSGGNSDELHLIPSMAVQHQKSPLSSPNQNLSPIRTVSPDRVLGELVPEKLPLSVEDIAHLLENDELSGDDLFSLLIDSCMKSSASSSPSSSAESTKSWSSPLSSSSSSSSTSSTSSSSMPSSLSMSSSSVLQLPPSSMTYSSTLPYSLSLPPYCKMSSHTSFEFKVKSCGSTPSTPVFSPIRSRTKRNMTHLKPSTLTADEIAEIWGVFEQRQAFMFQQHCQK